MGLAMLSPAVLRSPRFCAWRAEIDASKPGPHFISNPVPPAAGMGGEACLPPAGICFSIAARPRLARHFILQRAERHPAGPMSLPLPVRA